MASREAALVALETLLKTILISNGYALDVKKVTRQFETIKSIAPSDLPCLIIEDDGDEEINPTTGDCADILPDINIIGYISSNDETSTKINELESAMVKAVYSDVKLGGAVANMRIQPTVDRSGSKFHPYGFFVRPVKLTYAAQLSNGI